MGDSIKRDDRAACNKTPDCVSLQKGKWDAAQMLEVHIYRVTINITMEVTFFCSASPGLVRSASLSHLRNGATAPRAETPGSPAPPDCGFYRCGTCERHDQTQWSDRPINALWPALCSDGDKNTFTPRFNKKSFAWTLCIKRIFRCVSNVVSQDLGIKLQ